MFFVSLHTQTLQKPYSKHTQSKEGSYFDPWPFTVRSDSDPQVLFFIIRVVLKDYEDSIK